MRSELTGTAVCSYIPQAKTSDGVVRSCCIGIDDVGVVRVSKVLRLTRGNGLAVDISC
jgi:hypothetical protein